MPSEFRNEPFTDFSKEENAQAMRDAIQKVKEQLGREYPLVIGGERITTGNMLDSINPANRTQVVGRFHKATKELANQAVEEACESVSNVEEHSGCRSRGATVSRGRDPARTQTRNVGVDDPRSRKNMGRGRRRHR